MATSNLDILRPAAEQGNIDLLYTVINDYPSILEDIDSKQLFETPLHIAASKGHIPFAIEIMNWKPSFALKLNPEGLSPMHLAIQNKRMVLWFVHMNKELVRVKGKGGWTPLHLASQIGDVDVLAVLVDACPDSLEDVTVWGETALHIAAKNDNYDALYLLVSFLRKDTGRNAQWLENKIINWKDEDDNTIMHISAQNNHPKKTMLLLIKCPLLNLNAKNFENKTALDMAVTEEIKSILLRAGAKPASAVTDSQTLASRIKSKILFTQQVEIYISRVKSGILDGTRDTFLIIMTLTVTATYQSVLSPPGGFYQANATDNNLNITSSNSTISSLGSTGKSVMSRDDFISFSNFNMVSFLISIITIVVLMPRGLLGFISVLLPLYLLSVSYIFSMNMISPGRKNYETYVLIIIIVTLSVLFPFYSKLYSKFQQLLIAMKPILGHS